MKEEIKINTSFLEDNKDIKLIQKDLILKFENWNTFDNVIKLVFIKNWKQLYIFIYSKIIKFPFSFLFDVIEENSYESLQNIKKMLYDMLSNVYIWDIKNSKDLYKEENLNWVIVKQWDVYSLIYDEHWKTKKQSFNIEKYLKVIIWKIFDKILDCYENYIEQWRIKSFTEKFIIDSKNL